jgi:Ca2+-binding RTX toxin-like protein
MNLFNKKWLGRLGSRSRAVSGRAQRVTPSMEALEARDVPSTLLIFDFDGATAAEYGRMQNQLYGVPVSDAREGFSSFLGGFRALQAEGYATYSFLDFNDDGQLDEVDGNLAAERILDQVREEFAPYDVLVVREDNSDTARARMAAASATGDTILFLDGRDTGGGQASVNPGNTQDDSGWVGGSVGYARKVNYWLKENRELGDLTDSELRDAFVQDIAVFGAAHEAGHTFGLFHIGDPSAWDINIMAGGNYRNGGFVDRLYDSVDDSGRPRGPQNEHQYLTEVLGASSKPWAAVLRPGELTIQGSSYDDSVSVSDRWFSDDPNNWHMTVRYRNPLWGWYTREYRVDPDATPDFHSLNPFQTTIGTIRFTGSWGNDSLSVSDTIRVPVIAFGGAGNDTLRGGGGGDQLHGEWGDDTLVGGGGDDRLYGSYNNDYLSGEAGNDVLDGGDHDDRLVGGSGLDVLYGRAGNDRLDGGGGQDFLDGGTGDDRLDGGRGPDGGRDGTRDYLLGGTGRDTFVDYRYQQLSYDPWRGLYWVWVSEDEIWDFNAVEDTKEIR